MILYQLKSFFKCGNITIHKNEARFEIMGYENNLKYVIPHFDKYPLITKKNLDYLLWKDIIILQNNKEHLTNIGFNKCLSLKASLNKGLNPLIKTLFPNIIPSPRGALISPKKIEPNWLSGFVAGDGSFLIIISKNKNCLNGYQISTVFNLAQHSRDSELIKKIQLFLNCGKVYKTNKEIRIVIKKFSDILGIILPYFKKYPLNNNKEFQFYQWCKVVNMLKNKEHLTIKGLNIIKNIRKKR